MRFYCPNAEICVIGNGFCQWTKRGREETVYVSRYLVGKSICTLCNRARSVRVEC